MRTPIRTILLPALAVVLGCGLWLAAALADDSATTGERESTGSDRSREASPETGTEGSPGAARTREPRALLPGSTRPPQPLKKVGDHWTPYDPPDPESFPKDATLHIIVPGDTLWDLADLTFGNPYLWPQIWNENRYIVDSHWIYPGDPLLLPPRPTVIGEVVPQGQAGAPAPGGDETAGVPGAELPDEPADDAMADHSSAEPAPGEPQGPPVLADEGDVRCGGVIRPKDKRLEYFIANQEEENKVALSENDIVYVSRNRKGDLPEPGAEFSIVIREGEVRHPVTNRLLGYYYKRAGTLRVLASQEETSLAKIVMACDYIRTGYELMPLTVGALPSATPPTFRRFDTLDPSKPSGYIVHTTDTMKRVGTGYLVDIDLGYEDGMKVGDFLKVYIPTDAYDRYRSMDYDYKWENQRFESSKLRKERGSVPPPRLIGQLVVIATEQRTSTAKILYSVREIEVGQHVEPY